MAFPDGWAGYTEITLTNPASALTDFTYLLNLNMMPSAWWSAVQGGGDVRVTDASNNLLPLDPISFTDSGSSGSGLHAFKFSPASSGTQKVRIWAGKSGESQPAVGDTYGQYNAYDANTRGFWPLGGGNDRTSFVNHLTMTGSPSVGGAAGPIDGTTATDLDGSTQFGVTAVSVPTAAPLTFMAMGKTDSLTADQCPVSIGDTATGSDAFYLTWRGGAGGDPIRAETLRSAAANAVSPTGFTTAWHHGTARYASATSRDAAIDGSFGSANTTSLAPLSLDSIGIGLLRRSSNTFLFNGLLAFASIHTVALSNDWVAYHAAMLDPDDPDQSSFYGSPTWVPAASAFPQVMIY